MTISYRPYLYNVAPAVFGLPVAVPYTAGSGSIVLQSVVGLPAPPFRLTVVTLASAQLPGPNRVFTVFGVTAVNTLTNVLTISEILEGTSDRNFAIGDLAGIIDNAGAITDLNAMALLSVPEIITGVVASGNSISNATQLIGNVSVQEVVTTAPGEGVILPPLSLPSDVTIVNIGSYALVIYPYPGCTIYGSSSPVTLAPSPPGATFLSSSATNWYSILGGGGGGGGSGTVTSVSIVSANGLTGTVANPTTTPNITIATSASGILKGVGGVIEPAVADTDYQVPITLTTIGTTGAAMFSGNSLNIPQYSGGTVTTTGSPVSGNMAKFSASSSITTAVAGTDYQAPINLTTSGSSGAATFIGNTLNIPQYGSGGGGGSVGPGVVGQIATFASTTSVGSTTTGLEIDQSFGAINAQTAGSGTVTLNLSLNNKFQITLTGNIVVAFSGGNVGQTFSIAYIQAGSGGYTVTYSGSTLKWANETVPVITTTVGGIDLLSFYCPATNTYWGGVALPNIG